MTKKALTLRMNSRRHDEKEEFLHKIERKKKYTARLEELLGCGRYQYLQILFLTGIMSFLGSTFFFQLSFTIADGDHRCRLPPENEDKYYLLQH